MTTSTNAIDWPQCLQLANGREDLAQELLQMLLERLPTELEQIAQAFTQKDWPQLQDVVHKLHGASCYTGVPALKDAAALLEHALREQDYTNLDELVHTLQDEIQAVQNEGASQKVTG